MEFNLSSISNGIIEFCEKFDYESLQPSKLGNRNDLIGWINRLLRIRKNTFTLNDLNKVFSQKIPTSSNHKPPLTHHITQFILKTLRIDYKIK
jgi:hypothetical protein